MSQAQLNAEMRSVTNSVEDPKFSFVLETATHAYGEWNNPDTGLDVYIYLVSIRLVASNTANLYWSKQNNIVTSFFVLIFRLSPGTRQAMRRSNYEGKILACFHWDPASSFSRFGNELNWGGWSILVTQLVWVIQSIWFLNVICWCLSLKHATLTRKERHSIQYSSLSTVINYST